MERDMTLLGGKLTPSEAERLRWVQERGYRCPRTHRTMEETLATMDKRLDYQVSNEAGRAALRHWMRERYRRRATAATADPNSPYYMREAVHRIARERLEREAAEGTVTIQAARRRSHRYGLKQWDDDVIALQDRVFGFGGVR